MDIKKILLQLLIIFLIKKFSVSAATLANKSAIKNENITNKELLENYWKILKKEKYSYLL